MVRREENYKFPSPLVLHSDGGLLIPDNKQNKVKILPYLLLHPYTAGKGRIDQLLLRVDILNAHLVLLMLLRLQQ